MNMLDNIKTRFTIKDLENLSGIKAHTIRIWEQRYNILEPHRTSTNIRYYDIENLQKLLNVKLLYDSGFKISKIAKLSPSELSILLKEHVTQNEKKDAVLMSFKLAMINFDQQLFEQTYNQLLAHKTVREIFLEYFVPLLNDIGLLWQTNTITPAQEHFVFNLIKQKLHSNIERLQINAPEKTDKVFVLFLPLNEIHELGLLYLQYEIALRGYQSIYLGQSVPIQSLESLLDRYTNLVFISYFTIKPSVESLPNYLNEFDEKILSKKKQTQFWILGNKLKEAETLSLPKKTQSFDSIKELSAKI